MTGTTPQLPDPFESLLKTHEIIFGKMDELYEGLRDLQFEGKLHVRKNLNVIRRLVVFFDTDLRMHIEEDENVVFPFLEAKVPKLFPMLSFLRADHAEFYDTLNKLEYILGRLAPSMMTSRELNDQLLRIREKGTYLICQMRNHMQTETEGAYRAIERYLTAAERKELAGRIHMFHNQSRKPSGS